MNAINLLTKLRGYPIFSAKEVTNLLDCNKKYANLVLTRLYNKKIVKRVDFGKYTLCNLAQTVATHIIKPSYISGWYSLRFYNLTEQLPQQIDVLTSRKKNKKIIVFGNEKIRYLTVDKNYLFEFFNENSEQYTMNIASIEKTIVDCLYFDLVPLLVIMQAIKIGEGKISLNKIEKISLKLRNKQFFKKIGVVFDSLGYDLYKSFKKYLDYNFLIIDKNLCELLDKSKLKKWRVRCR